MKKFLFPLVALALSFVACQSDIKILNTPLDIETPDFTASFEDDTRTHLSIDGNKYRILWNDTDAISVFSKIDHNLRYRISSTTNNGAYANFTYTYEYVRGTGARFGYYYAAYPWSTENKIVDEAIQMNIPAVQNYDAANDFVYVPLVAKATSFSLSFNAASSVLCVAMAKDANSEAQQFLLKSLTVTSNSVDLAGRVSVDMTADTFKAVVDPSLGDTSKSVTLDLGEGVELTTDTQNFSLALPEVVFPANDFSVTCLVEVDGESRVLKITRDQEIAFTAGRIKRLTVNVDKDMFTGNFGGDIDGEIDIEDDKILDEPLVVPAGGNATLNVGGTISLLPTNPNSSLVVVEEGATLTINGDGALTTVVNGAQASATRAASNKAFPIVVNGTLIINGCDFTLDSFDTSWLDCGIYVAEGGELIVSGGTFRSTKGSSIFGHEIGKRPSIKIHGGRFEGYDPSNNDFDGNGTNFLEPEYASYAVSENELVVATRTTDWEVDNSYLLNSILKNGGNATLVDPVDNFAGFYVDNNIIVNYPVNITVSGDSSKVSGYCNVYLDNPISCYADVSIKCDYTEGDLYSDTLTPDKSLLYVDSLTAIANVYNGATLTLGDGNYFGGSDEISETLFNVAGGNIVVNEGEYTLYARQYAPKMFTAASNDYYQTNVTFNRGDFYGFNPETLVKDGLAVIPEGKGSVLWTGGAFYGVRNVGNFNAASYNVDGLPNIEVNLVITKISLNPDGPLSDGTKAISSKLAQSNWDIIAFQEDFNFHTELTSQMGGYTFGTHRGGVTAANSELNKADTDGLGFATLKSTTSFSNQTYVPFDYAYGGLTKGANTCIKKGFRYYTVTLEGGAEIDVYVTHMNSGGSDSNYKDARAKQFKQLAAYINAHDNGRPVLLLGDFNTRYTRDDVFTNFFTPLGDKFNYFCDPWVKFWDKTTIGGETLFAAGVYPTLNTGSLMVPQEDGYEYSDSDIKCTEQGGEVVDKIMYINNPLADVMIEAQSFMRDLNYTEADHAPVVSEFVYYY